MKKYTKLIRESIKALKSQESICENNIKFERLKNGDGRYSVYGKANGIRFNRIVGLESHGVTRSQAEEVLLKLMQDAKENRFSLPKGRKNEPLFQALVKQYIDQLRQISGKNIERKEKQLETHVIPFFKNKPLSQINTFEIERFKNHLKVEFNYSDATVNQYLAVLSHFANKAIEWGWIQHKPYTVKKYKLNNARSKYLTSDQCQKLLDEASKDTYPIIYPFIMIALNTAMRRSEILEIRLDDIDLERHMIYIPKAKCGARVQPMTAKLAKYLAGYIPMVPKENNGLKQPWLFPSKLSKSGHYETIERPFRRVVLAAGMDPYEVLRHTLRHTAITHLVQSGVDLPTVMRISGHKSLSMVQRYSHQSGDHIDTAMEKLEKRYNL